MQTGTFEHVPSRRGSSACAVFAGAFLLVWVGAGLMSGAAASTPPRLTGPVYADYAAELRESTPRSDGINHVDTPALIQKLLAGNIKTYAFLIWHQPTDWDDFRLEFLPAAQAAQLNVWLYLTPPSENNPPTGYVPYGTDYVTWATETAKLAQQYPVLKALAIDDFYGNQTFFTPFYVSTMMHAAHAWCTNLIFVPVNYDLSHSRNNPTRVISPAFANNYGPYCGGVIFPYLNWTNMNDFSDEAAQIANNSEILNGKLSQFVAVFPANRPSQAGNFAALIQTLTNMAGFPDTPFPFQFRLSDSYSGPTTNYHKLQVLVDSTIVWEGDTAGDSGIRDISLNLQNQLKRKTTAALRVRVYEAKGVSNHGVTVSWNLPSGNWTISETGAFMGTSTYYPATPGLNVPLVVMIYDGGYGSGTNHWGPTTNYIRQANLIARSAMLAGYAVGIIQYSMSKTSSSRFFPIVQELYGLWLPQPFITTQPLARTVMAGSNATFSVAAVGDAPLYYQWWFNGAAIPGATATAFTRTNAQLTFAGNYAVVITNLSGSMTSLTAGLIVNASPSITRQPQSLFLPAAQTATFDVAVAGTQPLAYQWRFNGNAIPGATASSCSLSPIQGSNNGFYCVVITNGFGAVTSSNAALTVLAVVGAGDNTSGQTSTPLGVTNVVAIAAGARHNLALRADGTVLAWGSNCCGQCDVPSGLTDALAIAAGGYHSLALRANGTVSAWGNNDYSQTNVPPALKQVMGLAAGTWHSLALKADGTVAAWGDNSFGQCSVPAGLSNVVGLAAGGNHSLALQANGCVVSWGRNTDAEGSYAGQAVSPLGLSNVVALGAGDYHSLAVLGTGQVVAWGDNGQGQCNVPAGLSNVVAVAGGGAHSLALRADGSVVAWGKNWNGQCTLPAALSDAVAVDAGERHSLVLVAGSLPALRLWSPARQDHRFIVLVQTLNRKHYTLQYRDSLATNWAALSTNAGNGALSLLSDPAPGVAMPAATTQRFYRVWQW